MGETSITIIGIDCATESRKVGLAVAFMEQLRPRLRETGTGRRGQSSKELTEQIAEWIPDNGTTLLALDAPLGWPANLGQALLKHSAGTCVNVIADELFRRETDRFVEKMVHQRPLDVGADRIARTAHAALILLRNLREKTKRPIPLAWNPTLQDSLSAIEVYPAATLRAHGFRSSGYKRSHQKQEREEIIMDLSKHLEFSTDTGPIEANADILDAVICVLAAIDFLSDESMPPVKRELAVKEGWIWVRFPKTS